MIIAIPELRGEAALEELFQNYFYLAHELWDPQEVYCGPGTWAEALLIGVVKIITAEPESEYSMDTKFQIGERVRLSGTNGVAAQDGEVLINNAIVTEVDSFDGMSSPNVDIENMRRLAQLVKVKWFGPDGGVVCIGWHTPEQLELKP